MNVNAIVLKPGLRFEPSKRLDKEVWVKIYRCSFNDDDEAIVKALEEFGVCTSEMEYINFGPSEDPLLDSCKHILTPDRRIRMKLFRSIPSFIMVGTRRFEVKHAGQVRCCARCCCPKDHCPGLGKAKVCEDNGGPKRKLINVWNEVKSMAPVLNVTQELDCDYLEFSGFQPTDEIEDVYNFIYEYADVTVVRDAIVKTSVVGVWRLPVVSSAQATAISKGCNMRKRSGKNISVLPYQGDVAEDDSEKKLDEDEEEEIRKNMEDRTKKDGKQDKDKDGGPGGAPLGGHGGQGGQGGHDPEEEHEVRRMKATMVTTKQDLKSELNQN